MAKSIIGVDIGTTSICGVAIDAAGGILAVVERPNDSAIHGLPPGRAEQNPARILHQTYGVLSQLRQQVASMEAVGFTGQMHGMLCVDDANHPVSNLITWQDSRCLEQAPEGGTWLSQIRSRVNDRDWEPCGCLPASGFMGPTLHWMLRNGCVPDRTARVCFIHDWVAAQLAGQMPVTDPSDAGSSGVFDLDRLEWNTRILEKLEVPAKLMPPVHESGEAVGRVSSEAAANTGIAAGTSVCNAVGDNQASVIGSIADLDHSLLLNVGTGGQISWTVPHFRRVSGMETRYLPRGRYMLVGASLCGGRAYAWLNGVLQAWLAEFGCQAGREQIYAHLNALAAAAPADCGGLSVRTTLAGTRIEPAIRGAVSGVSLDNFGLGNVARAVLGGIVDELCDMYDQAGGRPVFGHSKAVGSGNAVRKNPLLAGLMGRRTGCPVLVARHREEAAFGAALLAGAGVGTWPSLEAAGQLIQYA